MNSRRKDLNDKSTARLDLAFDREHEMVCLVTGREKNICIDLKGDSSYELESEVSERSKSSFVIWIALALGLTLAIVYAMGL